MVARRQQREQPRRIGRDPRRVEQGPFGARLHPGQRIGERPHGRRPAPAIIKLVVRRMAARLEVGDIVVKDRRGAPDRRIDDSAAEPGIAGPLGPPSALHEFGRRAEAWIVVLAHRSLVSGARAKIQRCNDVEQTNPFALSLSTCRCSFSDTEGRTVLR